MQLGLNFHRTFIPERRLIAALLEYAAKEKSGTYAEIAAETGIPMGKSTGKVPAILDYARGMGLLNVEAGDESSSKRPVLTPFGRVVFEEDRYLGEPLTQWLAHLHLCLPNTGAKAWYLTFGEGRTILGTSFSVQQLEEYLVSFLGPGSKRIGPLVRMYLDDAAFARCSVLRQHKNVVVREKAPLLDEYAYSYAALFLLIMDIYFPDQYQVTMHDINSSTRCFDVSLWSESDIEKICSLVEQTGLIGVDRQMRPWILEKKANSIDAWRKIYSDIP